MDKLLIVSHEGMRKRKGAEIDHPGDASFILDEL
jgi:hypothetical protein